MHAYLVLISVTAERQAQYSPRDVAQERQRVGRGDSADLFDPPSRASQKEKSPRPSSSNRTRQRNRLFDPVSTDLEGERRTDVIAGVRLSKSPRIRASDEMVSNSFSQDDATLMRNPIIRNLEQAAAEAKQEAHDAKRGVHSAVQIYIMYNDVESCMTFILCV